MFDYLEFARLTRLRGEEDVSSKLKEPPSEKNHQRCLVSLPVRPDVARRLIGTTVNSCRTEGGECE